MKYNASFAILLQIAVGCCLVTGAHVIAVLRIPWPVCQ
jgi:hypothetical protein